MIKVRLRKPISVGESEEERLAVRESKSQRVRVSLEFPFKQRGTSVWLWYSSESLSQLGSQRVRDSESQRVKPLVSKHQGVRELECQVDSRVTFEYPRLLLST